MGPFRLLIEPNNPMSFLNYAVPVSTVQRLHDIEDLIKAFEAVDRMPRLEFTNELWPGLADALLDRGFNDEGSNPRLVCHRDDFRSRVNPEVSVEFLTSASDLSGAIGIQQQGFTNSMTRAPRAEDTMINRWRTCLDEGIWQVATGAIEGRMVSIGTGIPGSAPTGEPIFEICGVTTLPDFRNRGAASTVISTILMRTFQSEGIAWLAAGTDDAQSVYERLGFKFAGIQRNLSLVAE